MRSNRSNSSFLSLCRHQWLWATKDNIALAAMKKNWRVVREWLLNDETNLNFYFSVCTALHWAAKHGKADIVALLLERLADPNLLTKKSSLVTQESALHIAVNNGDIVSFCVLALNENTNYEIQDENKQTPIQKLAHNLPIQQQFNAILEDRKRIDKLKAAGQSPEIQERNNTAIIEIYLKYVETIKDFSCRNSPQDFERQQLKRQLGYAQLSADDWKDVQRYFLNHALTYYKKINSNPELDLRIQKLCETLQPSQLVRVEEEKLSLIEKKHQ